MPCFDTYLGETTIKKKKKPEHDEHRYEGGQWSPDLRPEQGGGHESGRAQEEGGVAKHSLIPRPRAETLENNVKSSSLLYKILILWMFLNTW